MTNIDREKLWLDRLRKYIADNSEDPHRAKVCSWWLRLEYDNRTPTPQINYWLNKSVKKGILAKETSCYYTKYWFVEDFKTCRYCENEFQDTGVKMEYGDYGQVCENCYAGLTD